MVRAPYWGTDGRLHMPVETVIEPSVSAEEAGRDTENDYQAYRRGRLDERNRQQGRAAQMPTDSHGGGGGGVFGDIVNTFLGVVAGIFILWQVFCVFLPLGRTIACTGCGVQQTNQLPPPPPAPPPKTPAPQHNSYDGDSYEELGRDAYETLGDQD